jgi:hypothetical protein
MLPAVHLRQEQQAAILPIRNIAFLIMPTILWNVIPQAFLIILLMGDIA